MITSFMRDAEMYEEIRKDFLEMKSIMKTALNKFNKEQSNLSPGKYLLHSIVQTKTYQTRQHNVWTIRLQDCGEGPMGSLMVHYLTYLPVLHRDGRTEYIFMHNIDQFYPEKLTAHFIQRYKERYLIPHNINLNGAQVAVHFMYHNRDRKSTCFKPTGWTEEELEKKKFWISDLGLFVTAQNDNMRTYITFLDQENLSRYRTMVYEEEKLMRSFRDTKTVKDPEEGWENASKLMQNPNAEKILERYIRRTSELKGEELEQYILSLKEELKVLIAMSKQTIDKKTNSIIDLDIFSKFKYL